MNKIKAVYNGGKSIRRIYLDGKIVWKQFRRSVEEIEGESNDCLIINDTLSPCAIVTNGQAHSDTVTVRHNTNGGTVHSAPEQVASVVGIHSDVKVEADITKPAIHSDEIGIRSSMLAYAKDMSGATLNGNVAPMERVIGSPIDAKGSTNDSDTSVLHNAPAFGADVGTSPALMDGAVKHSVSTFDADTGTSPMIMDATVQHCATVHSLETKQAASNANIYLRHSAISDVNNTGNATVENHIVVGNRAVGEQSDTQSAMASRKVLSICDNVEANKTVGRPAHSNDAIAIKNAVVGGISHAEQANAESSIGISSDVNAIKSDAMALAVRVGSLLGSSAIAEAFDTPKYKYPAMLKISDGDGEHTVSVLIELTDEYPLENVSDPVPSGDDYIIQII